MDNIATIIAAVIGAVCAIWVAVQKRNSDDEKELVDKVNTHETKIAQIEIRLATAEEVKKDLAELKSKIEKIQEKMVTKEDMRLHN